MLERRAVLIQKSRDLGLTEEERNELDHIQAEIDRRLDAVDRQMLGMAEEFRQQVEALPDVPQP